MKKTWGFEETKRAVAGLGKLRNLGIFAGEARRFPSWGVPHAKRLGPGR